MAFIHSYSGKMVQRIFSFPLSLGAPQENRGKRMKGMIKAVFLIMLMLLFILDCAIMANTIKNGRTSIYGKIGIGHDPI